MKSTIAIWGASVRGLKALGTRNVATNAFRRVFRRATREFIAATSAAAVAAAPISCVSEPGGVADAVAASAAAGRIARICATAAVTSAATESPGRAPSAGTVTNPFEPGATSTIAVRAFTWRRNLATAFTFVPEDVPISLPSPMRPL